MAEKPIAYDAYETFAAQYAATIDHRPYNAFYDRPAVLSLLPEDLSGWQVLDAGCGPGAYVHWLVEHGAEVGGVDSSPQFIAFAQQRVGTRARFHHANLNELLDFLDDETFDLVLSALVISYLADLNQFFGEVARLLRSGGLFVFSTDHPMTDYERHGGNYFETVAVSDAWGILASGPIDVPFYRRPLSAITEALWANGFVIERLIEPLPTAEFQQANPEDYEKLLRRPQFIALRARRATMVRVR